MLDEIIISPRNTSFTRSSNHQANIEQTSSRMFCTGCDGHTGCRSRRRVVTTTGGVHASTRTRVNSCTPRRPQMTSCWRTNNRSTTAYRPSYDNLAYFGPSDSMNIGRDRRSSRGQLEDNKIVALASKSSGLKDHWPWLWPGRLYF